MSDAIRTHSASLAVPTRPPDAAVERPMAQVTDGPLGWKVLRFGLPLVIGMFLYTTFNLIDMFMISRLENAKAALAALGICDMVAALPTIVSNGISTGTVAIVSRRLGEGDRGGAAEAAWQSLLLVGLCSLFFGLVGLFGSETVITSVMQAKGEVATLAARYLQVLMGGAFAIFFLLQITAILRAAGRSKSAAALLVSGNVLNIALNLLLIYGPGPRPKVFAFAQPIAVALGVPRLGLQGTAWATLIGRTVPVAVGLVILVRTLGGSGAGLAVLRPRPEMLRRLVSVGWPSSLQLVVRIGAILTFISLINASYTSATDAHTLTAYSICLRLETLVLFLGMGWGAAASTFMGANLGQGQPARAMKSGWVAAAYGALFTVFLVLAFTTWSDPILGFFESSPDVLAAGREYLDRVAWSYVVLAVGVVLSQALTGAGATRASLFLDASVLLFGVIPSAVLVSEVLRAPAVDLWTVIAVGNLLGAAAFAAYYRRGKFLQQTL